MARIGVTTYGGRVKKALAMKNGDQLWMAIGRTTPWANETSPPSPTPGSTDIEEAICFVQPSQVSLCKEVDETTYNGLPSDQRATIAGLFFEFVADVDAYTENARFLYIRGIFDPSLGHPVDVFRQVGVFSGLIPAAGYEAATYLSPDNVDDRGLLEYIENGEYVNMTPAGPKTTCHAIIEFR